MGGMSPPLSRSRWQTMGGPSLDLSHLRMYRSIHSGLQTSKTSNPNAP